MRVLMVTALGLLVACVESRRTVPPDLAPRRVVEARTYMVSDTNGNELGWLRELQILDPAATTAKFLVENRQGQWVGFIDADGLVTRRGRLGDEVLASDAGLVEGARLLFGLAEAPLLRERE